MTKKRLSFILGTVTLLLIIGIMTFGVVLPRALATSSWPVYQMGSNSKNVRSIQFQKSIGLQAAGIVSLDNWNKLMGTTSGDSSLLTNDQGDQMLAAAGFTWSASGNCQDRNSPNCTSFDQMQASTLSYLITWAQANNITGIMVTGGSETGHADSGTAPAPSCGTHYNGYKLDIALGTAADNIIPTYTQVQSRSNGDPQYKDNNGVIYALESNHWDIFVPNASCPD